MIPPCRVRYLYVCPLPVPQGGSGGKLHPVYNLFTNNLQYFCPYRQYLYSVCVCAYIYIYACTSYYQDLVCYTYVLAMYYLYIICMIPIYPHPSHRRAAHYLYTSIQSIHVYTLSLCTRCAGFIPKTPAPGGVGHVRPIYLISYALPTC